MGEFSHLMKMIRPLIVYAVSILGIASIAFCGFVLIALPEFLYLVDPRMYASFIATLSFNAASAIGIGRLCVVLMSAFIGQMSAPRVHGDRSFGRKRRIIYWLFMSRSPVALQYTSISLSLVAFAFLYLGWHYAVFYLIWLTLAFLGGFVFIFRFRRRVIHVIFPSLNSAQLLKLIAERKLTFTVSTIITALAFSLGMAKAGAILGKEKVWICDVNISFEGTIIGRSSDGLIVVSQDGDHQNIRIVSIEAQAYTLSITNSGCH